MQLCLYLSFLSATGIIHCELLIFVAVDLHQISSSNDCVFIVPALPLFSISVISLSYCVSLFVSPMRSCSVSWDVPVALSHVFRLPWLTSRADVLPLVDRCWECCCISVSTCCTTSTWVRRPPRLDCPLSLPTVGQGLDSTPFATSRKDNIIRISSNVCLVFRVLMVIFALFGCVKVPTLALHTSIDTPMLLDNHFVLGLNCICKWQRLVRYSPTYNFHNYLDGCSQFYTSSVDFKKHLVTRSLFVNTTYLKQHCTVDFHSLSTNQLHFTAYVHSIYRYIDIVVKDYLTIDIDVT